jgi:hypothetical protein
MRGHGVKEQCVRHFKEMGGYTGADGGTCSACAAGKYKDAAGSSGCSDCGAGTYLTTTGASTADTCTPCPPNSQSQSGRILLTSCRCQAGHTGADGGTCAACAAGKYKEAIGSVVCTDCGAGKYLASTGASASNACADCGTGTYSLTTGASTASFCVDCPVNTYSTTTGASTADTCTSCPPNSQSPSRSSLLTNCQCHVGYTGADGGECSACVAGKYKEAIGSGECIDCGDGKYLTLTGVFLASSCIDCVAGKYSTAVGASLADTCIECAANSYSTVVGATMASTCTNCPSGSVSMVGSIASVDCLCNIGFTGANGGPCAACVPGKYKAVTGTVACTDCGAGKYLTSTGATVAISCVECSVGKYSITAGAFLSSTCIECGAGKYSTTVGASVESACVICAENSQSPSGSTLKTSCQCNTGYTGAYGGVCSACVAGKYKNVIGSATCVNCPANSQSPSASILFTSCICEAGYTGADGGTCSACPQNTYKSVIGSASCLACPVNSYSPEGSTAKMACLCSVGYETTLCADLNIAACAACPTGKYKAVAGLASGCRLCESDLASSTGVFDSASPYCVCRAGYVLANGVCTACQTGTYKEQQGNSTLGCASLLAGCCQCGQFQTTLGATSSVALADCVCMHGHGVQDPNNFACVPCPRGTYKEGMDRQACAACPANTDTLQVGAFDAHECVSRAGYFMVYDAEGVGTASVCQSGTYSDHMNATACEPCFAGASSPPASESIGACACQHPFAPSGEAHDCTCASGFAFA